MWGEEASLLGVRAGPAQAHQPPTLRYLEWTPSPGGPPRPFSWSTSWRSFSTSSDSRPCARQTGVQEVGAETEGQRGQQSWGEAGRPAKSKARGPRSGPRITSKQLRSSCRVGRGQAKGRARGRVRLGKDSPGAGLQGPHQHTWPGARGGAQRGPGPCRPHRHHGARHRGQNRRTPEASPGPAAAAFTESRPSSAAHPLPCAVASPFSTECNAPTVQGSREGPWGRVGLAARSTGDTPRRPPPSIPRGPHRGQLLVPCDGAAPRSAAGSSPAPGSRCSGGEQA